MDNQQMFDLLMGELGKIHQEMGDMRQEIDTINNRSIENQDLLKALLHAHEVTDARTEANTVQLAKAQGDIIDLENEFAVTVMQTAQNTLNIGRLKAQ